MSERRIEYMPLSRVRPAKRGPGRPTKLTPEIQAEICKRIQLLATLREAIADLELDENTVLMWVRRGEAEKSGRYFQFMRAYRAALARRAMNAKMQIIAHAKKHFVAADRALQLADPTTVPQVRIHVTHELNNAIERLCQAFSDEPETLRRALAAISGDSGEGQTERDGGGIGAPIG